jgi:hypothetical protein
MSALSLPAIPQKLDDEIFFAILDVALDVETELLIGSERIYIPVRRLAVRYDILYQVHWHPGDDRSFRSSEPYISTETSKDGKDKSQTLSSDS